MDGREIYSFVKPYPPVITVTTRALESWREDAPTIESVGYRFVEHMPFLPARRYVRPLPLWLCHKLGIALYGSFWGSLRWLYRRGVIRLANCEGTKTRLCDIRPWPMKGIR